MLFPRNALPSGPQAFFSAEKNKSEWWAGRILGLKKMGAVG
jgi:hypothetical protein